MVGKEAIDFLKEALERIDKRIDLLSQKLDERLDVLQAFGSETAIELERHEVKLANIESTLSEAMSKLPEINKEITDIKEEVHMHAIKLSVVDRVFSVVGGALLISLLMFIGNSIWQLITHGQPIINWLTGGTPTP